jgi:hypothetical protein
MTLTIAQRCAALVLLPAVAGAHHSFAMFDTQSVKTVQGTVRTFEFSYPHSWLWIDVPDGKGGVQPWGFESASPTELNRVAGWTRATVKKGDKVSVTYCPLRDGRHGGAFMNVLLPDGRKMPGAANLCIGRNQNK